MRTSERSVFPITAADEEIERHLADAELPPLLPALAHLTGDLSLLRTHLRPDPAMSAIAPQGGLDPARQAEVRQLAFEALVAYRDGGCVPAPPPSDENLLTIMQFAVGGAEMRAYLPLLDEELALRDADPRAPDWRLEDVAPGRPFSAVVIGAGMSGLLAAHRLRQCGIAVTVVEKDDDVGGTWFENRYPGCRVDNPNHNYSYSFAQRHDWPYHFSTQDVLLDYFRGVADELGLRDAIRFRTEAERAEWSDAAQRWSVKVRTAGGGTEVLDADAVISAVGQLNRPLLPDIPGRDSFEGPAFHTARWDASVDLAGKRVGVIGTGASAMQCIPELAGVASELVVFQRTPAWLVPTGDYHAPVPDGLRWLYTHVPSYSEWNRFWIFWRMGDGSLDGVRVDPQWDRSTGAVGAGNALMRMVLTSYLETQFADRPDLLAHVVPDYPPGAKRIIRDNGIWARTLKRDDVRLVTRSISAITPTGVATVDGTHHDLDVIVHGTGFAASKFLTPMTVRGRGGVDLHETWGPDASAHLGITVPGFPNFFCLYGPNTNIVINGSIIYFSECGVRYITGCLREVLERGAAAIDVRPDVHEAFRRRVDEGNRAMAWGASDVRTWYKSETGTVTQNWPFTLLEYWQHTLRPDPADHIFL